MTHLGVGGSFISRDCQIEGGGGGVIINLHTVLIISLLYLHSGRILEPEFEVNQYVCYYGAINWITQNYSIENGCHSIYNIYIYIYIYYIYIISNWMPFAT